MFGQIHDWIWGFLAGMVLTFYVLAAAFHYLPSPMELLGDVAADCRQHATIYKQEEAKPGEKSTEEYPTGLQGAQSNNLKNDPESQKREYDCLIAKYTGNLAVFTRWLVAATVILALFGFWQAMISRDTARRQLRAYIHVSCIRRASDEPFIFELDLKNFGQTPAHKVSAWYHGIVREFPIIGDLTTRSPEWTTAGKPSNGLLAPGDGVNGGGTRVEITETERQEIDRGKKAIYIFGDVQYLDVFKCRRWTTFRYIHSSGRFAVCDKGNEAK